MPKIVTASGPNIMSCLAEARRLLGVKLRGHRETLRSGGEDGCYRVHLESGDIVECAIHPRTRTFAEIQVEG